MLCVSRMSQLVQGVGPEMEHEIVGNVVKHWVKHRETRWKRGRSCVFVVKKLETNSRIPFFTKMEKKQTIIHTFHGVSLFFRVFPHWHPFSWKQIYMMQGATDDCEDRWQWWHHTFGLGCDHRCLFGTTNTCRFLGFFHEEFVKRMRFLMGYINIAQIYIYYMIWYVFHILWLS